MFRSCCQPSRSWRDGPYHKDSSRGNNNNYLGVWPNFAWQLCVEWFLGCNRSYPYSCNKGLLQLLPSTLASVHLHTTDPVIWATYWSIWKTSAGMLHFKPAQNSSSQQCSMGHRPSHATCIIQTLPGKWSIIPHSHYIISDQVIAYQLIRRKCWPSIWSYNNNTTKWLGRETHTMVCIHIVRDWLGTGGGSTRDFGCKYHMQI